MALRLRDAEPPTPVLPDLPAPRPAARRTAPASVPRQLAPDPDRDPAARRRSRRTAHDCEPLGHLLARLPRRGRALCALGCRRHDARGARVRARAQHHQADRRAPAGAAVRPVPREAGGGAARDDAHSVGSGAHRRQRGDSHERRPMVQRADGRGPVVRQPDRQRLLPRPPEPRDRPRAADCAHAAGRADAPRPCRPPTCATSSLRKSRSNGCRWWPSTACSARRRAPSRWCPSSTWPRRTCRPGTRARRRTGLRNGRRPVAPTSAPWKP